MSLEVTLFRHVSIRVASGASVVYFDPWKIDGRPGDADLVFVSHSHFDHCSPDDVAAVSGEHTAVFAPPDTAANLPGATAVSPGDTAGAGEVTIEAVPAYNVGTSFHPKSNGWCGAIVTIGGARVYFAGDTDLIPEMDDLADIHLALLPVGGTYTMDAREAADAAARIGCQHAVPCHWGEVVGDESCAAAFRDAAGCAVTVIAPGQTATIEV